MPDKQAGELRSPLRIKLEGPAVRQDRVRLSDLVLFGNQLQTALDRVARVLLGAKASNLSGRRPSEVHASCALEVVEVRGGSLTITCDLPPQDQLTLVDDLGEEALVSLLEGIVAVSSGQADLPKSFDKGVLLALREGGKLLDHGIDRITFDLRTRRGQWSHQYDREVHRRLVERIQGPVANRRTVEGRLLMGDFKETGLRCRVHPAAGRPISCTFVEAQRDAVLAALTRYVRLVGEAIERGGHIESLRIEDIEILDKDEDVTAGQEKGGAFFEPLQVLEALAAEQGVKPASDFDKLLGHFWPERESADDFIRTVRQWRREGEERKESR